MILLSKKNKMTKGYYDPWRKKSKKGMKTIGKAVDFTVKGGTFVANEMSRSQKRKQKREIAQREYTKQDWNIAVIFFVVFCIVGLCSIFVLTGFDINFRGFFGLIKFFITVFILLVVSGIISVVIFSFLEGSSKKQKSKNIPKTKEDIKIIDDIYRLLISDNDIADIDNVYSRKKLSKRVLVGGFEKAIESFLNNGVLDKEQEKKLSEFINFFQLKQEDLNENSAYERIVQSSILRDILEGGIPQKIKLGNQTLPFALNKNEKLVWISSNINYYEETVKNSYIGGSRGLSMKISNGLYYRVSDFKGHRIETQSIKYKGVGILGFTDKNIYFYSENKSFRISYSKIMVLLPYENAIKLQKDGVTAKPQIFDGISGWFIYNLITNLKKRE